MKGGEHLVPDQTTDSPCAALPGTGVVSAVDARAGGLAAGADAPCGKRDSAGGRAALSALAPLPRREDLLGFRAGVPAQSARASAPDRRLRRAGPPADTADVCIGAARLCHAPGALARRRPRPRAALDRCALYRAPDRRSRRRGAAQCGRSACLRGTAARCDALRLRISAAAQSDHADPADQPPQHGSDRCPRRYPAQQPDARARVFCSVRRCCCCADP